MYAYMYQRQLLLKFGSNGHNFDNTMLLSTDTQILANPIFTTLLHLSLLISVPSPIEEARVFFPFLAIKQMANSSADEPFTLSQPNCGIQIDFDLMALGPQFDDLSLTALNFPAASADVKFSARLDNPAASSPSLLS
jgi:hypothetical protein